MSSSEAVSEPGAESDAGIADRVESLAETVGPVLADQAESGNLAAVSGVVSLVRAGRTFLSGDRKRGALQALAGLFWIAVALAQRRSEASGGAESGGDLSGTVDTSPDIEAVDTDRSETDHATGEDVVDTTDADIEAADTAPAVDTDEDIDAETDGETIEERDVVETGVTDAGAEDEAELETDGEGDDGETTATDGDDSDREAE